MADTVLDLSSKSVSGTVLSQRSISDDASPSSPETPTRHPSSSDGNESDSSLPSSAIKPIAGPIPMGFLKSESPGARSDSQDRGDSSSPTTPTMSGLSRPFKSYSMDPLSMFPVQSSPLLAGHSSALPTTLSVGLGLSSLCDSSSFPSFPITPLTSHLLQRKRRAEGRTNSVSDSPTSDGKKLKHVTEDKKDDSYWERRRKNNEAAKRSRDNRRHKEEEIAMRAAYLEQENLKLRAQVAILKNETAKLHYMLYNRL